MNEAATITDPSLSAKAAGLRYLSDTGPGIRRRPFHQRFRFVDETGKRIDDPETIERIEALAIPHAWTHVWISPLANSYLQATGRNATGRKQSIYHPHWVEIHNENKYDRMIQFGDALPAIRKQVDYDLALPGLPREKVLATVVRLMETTSIRIGNEEYPRTNKSYGLTTLRNRHARVHGDTVTFDFTGKSGLQHTIDLRNKRLARVVKRCLDLPGYELFQFIGHDGNRHSITSGDVNDYLHQITGQHFTSKDFRTWTGTFLAALLLREFEPYDTPKQAKKNVVKAISTVAEHLGTPPSDCRKCYVHPTVLEHYFSGAMLEAVEAEVAHQVDQQRKDLRAEELALLKLLTKKPTTKAA